MSKVRMLNDIAHKRGQNLAQMALAWVLRADRITSVLIGASKISQIDDCVGALEQLNFCPEELTLIDEILKNNVHKNI